MRDSETHHVLLGQEVGRDDEEPEVGDLEVMRYMDDGRACLPPVKPGWRWESGVIKYKEEWRRIDKELSGQEITRRVLEGSM